MYFFCDYLVEPFKTSECLRRGDFLRSFPTQTFFVVLGLSKTHIKTRRLKTGEQFQFRREKQGAAKPYSCCDVVQWDILRRGNPTWPSITDKVCLKLGRALDSGNYRVLCSECGEEGPSSRYETDVRDLARRESFTLKSAFFQGTELYEGWLCTSCQNL
jgi:hypothetical protein